jgi:broad specificity phosphatase PhoE
MMEATCWWWIRHAPVTVNADRIYGNRDVPCDTSDRETFQRLAARLPRDAVWVTSHLQRTHQTAAAIVQHMSPGSYSDPLVEEDLAEQSFGDWQGRRRAELDQLRDDAWHRFWLMPAHAAPPGGESFEDLMTRVAAVVTRLSRDHAGRNIIAVTHGGTIRAAVGHALDLSPDRALGVAVENCSLTRLDHFPGSHGSHAPDSPGTWRISQVNAVMRETE